MFPNKTSKQNRSESNWRIRNNEENAPQNRYVSLSRFAETRLENVSWRSRSSQASSHSLQPRSGEEHCRRDLTGGHFAFWIIKDVNKLMKEVRDGRRDYQEYIEKELRHDRIVFVIKMFAKLCVASESYTVQILNLIANEKLIFNLELFLMKLTLQAVENRDFYSNFWADIEDFFQNMCDLLDAIIKSATTKACQILPRLFKTLEFCLPIFETGNNIMVSNHVKIKIAKLIEERKLHVNELGEDLKKKMVPNKKCLEENPEPSTSSYSSITIKGKLTGDVLGEQHQNRKLCLSYLLKWTTRDAHKIIKEVRDKNKHYEECIEEGMGNNKIVFVIKMFGKLCVASKSYQVEILNLITSEKLTVAAGEPRYYATFCSNFWADTEEFFNNMCEVLNAIIKNAPLKACQILPSLFNTLTVSLPILETCNDIKVSNKVKVKIAKLIEELEEQISQLRDQSHQSPSANASLLGGASCSSKSIKGCTTINEEFTHENLSGDILKVDFEQIENWSLSDDINEMGQQIINAKESFERYFEREISPDAIVMIFNSFAKLTVSSVSHKDIILKMVLNEKFLRNTETFLMKIQLHTVNVRKWNSYFWDNISGFFDNLTNVLDYVINTILTIEHHKSLLTLFETLERYLPMFEKEQNIQLPNEVKVMTVVMHEMLLESNEQNLRDEM